MGLPASVNVCRECVRCQTLIYDAVTGAAAAAAIASPLKWNVGKLYYAAALALKHSSGKNNAEKNSIHIQNTYFSLQVYDLQLSFRVSCQEERNHIRK